MAHSITSMAGLRGNSQAVLAAGSLHHSGAGRPSISLPVVARPAVLRAQQTPTEEVMTAATQTGRRAALGLVAAGLAGSAFANAVVLADVKSIKIGPPPPPSGGLPGTLNSDEARDLKLPLKERFYLQPLPPAEAAARAKESAKEILKVKELIEKKAWPYVQNDLRLRASYLRYDLNTVISAKPKDEKKPLKELTGKLFATIDQLDHAAKIKSTAEAEKYYTATKSAIDDVIAKLS